MKAYKIRKYKEGEEDIIETVIVNTEEEAIEEAKLGLNPKIRDDFNFEILSVKERKGQSKLSNFQDRYSYKPAYGDYEATGWMDEE